MKKILCLLCLMGSIAPAFSQMPKWCVPPYQIGFTPGGSAPPTALASNLPGASGAPNAAYDKNGNMLFYVTNTDIFLPNGTYTGILPSPACSERTIIPVPGFCDRFYIAYIFTKAGKSSLVYTMVEASSGNVTAVPGFQDIFVKQVSNTNYAGLAVSKADSKIRSIFTVGNEDASDAKICEFRVGSGGIVYQSQIFFTGHIEPPTEVELLEAFGVKTLAWGGYAADQNLHMAMFSSLGPGGGFSLYDIPVPGLQATYGVEFFDNGNKLVIAQDNATNANKGLFVMNLLTGLNSNLPSSQNYFNSQIEKAIDGKCYFIGQGNEFATLDPSTYAITNVLTLTGYPVSTYGRLLPDQVDDEDYSTANFKAELMARDATNDIGMEPNPSDDVWQSPDLWNRRDATGNPNDNQDPGYGSSASGNMMKMRVKNIGCETSQASHVRLYWTFGSTGEHWPNSWNGSTYLPGGQVAGEEITTGTGYSSATGYPVPALAPGAETIIEVKWYPPNPTLANLPANAMICFLGRIDDPQDLMFDERVSATTSTGRNIKYNNNIVTRNTNLVNLPGSFKYVPVGGSILVNNYLDNPTAFDVRFRSLTAKSLAFSDIGAVKLKLDQHLWEAWIAGGSIADGAVISDYDQREVLVTDLGNVRLKNITMQPGEFMGIAAAFELTATTDIIETYHFAFSQEKTEPAEAEEAYGSECVFVVTINGEEVGTGAEGEAERSSNGRQVQTAAGKQESTGKALLLYPNPSDDKVTVMFTSDLKVNSVQVSVTDMAGKTVRQFTQKAATADGQFVFTINVKDIKAGSYLLNIQDGGHKRTARLSVMH